MEREIIRKIIVEWQSIIPNIKLMQRPVEFEEKGNYVFVGIRQCGKSYLLYQRIQQLREGQGVMSGQTIEAVPVWKWLAE